ncbi:hypothetical protein [Planotetraspora phitsanulokensis]|uniref:Uncharacterized protein n=1 Tax=Planotetraspora phitsanulokensis TaxID=575192 RepID=A0A8J3UDP5_9ACTN|nr:hypothetical protein [Planotetraspora phitsanulokensis]GII42880.1 hypothetical protein Pph01_78830 [Planotetraspora phitsanulokensis]
MSTELPAPSSSAELAPTVLEGVVLGANPRALVRDGVLVCPYPDCGVADDIVELDIATRQNELDIVGPGEIAASMGDGNFEGDGFECNTCNQPVELPDGFEIVSYD